MTNEEKQAIKRIIQGIFDLQSKPGERAELLHTISFALAEVLEKDFEATIRSGNNSQSIRLQEQIEALKNFKISAKV
jgi:hypothetical protein